MATLKLNLPTIENTKTADVVRDMNALAEAIDAVAGANSGLATLGADGKVPSSQLNVQDATTTAKGIVQLEDSTTSTSTTKAATPNAVKVAKEGLANQIGTLTSLNTTAKTSLVAAVNELVTSKQKAVTSGTAVPSGGVDGDIYFQYE